MMDNFMVKLKNVTTTLSMTTNLMNQILMQPQKSDRRWHRCAIAARGRYQNQDVLFAKICN
jgi:hypothetical protein